MNDFEERSEPYEALWDRALWHLGRRDFGAKELRERLLRYRPNNKPSPSEEDVEKALARLQELGLIDDERRAERLTESLQRKGYGKRHIQMELRQRGLPEPEEAPEDEGEIIARLLQTKYAAKLGDERNRRLTVQALLRRGFQYAGIRDAMKLSDELDYIDDFE